MPSAEVITLGHAKQYSEDYMASNCTSMHKELVYATPKIFNLFGDPSMIIHTAMPENYQNVSVELKVHEWLDSNDSTRYEPYLNVELNHEYGRIAITDNNNESHLFKGNKAMLANPVLPCTIWITGKNKKTYEFTYYSPGEDISKNMDSWKFEYVNANTALLNYKLSKSKPSEEGQEGTLDSTNRNSLSILLYNTSTNQICLTHAIDGIEGVIELPKLSKGLYTIILTENGKRLDSRSIIIKN